MAIVDFNPDKPGPDDIHSLFVECKTAIEYRFDPDLNPTFSEDFALLSSELIEERKKRMLDELSLRASFFLLAYIESLFRTDLVLRVGTNRKGRSDLLTNMYKSEYNPAKKIFSYSLVDFIFERWKVYADNLPFSKEMIDTLRNLPQYFDFRNWMAHGRYWTYREANYMRKYNYAQVQMLMSKIQDYFIPFMKTMP